MVLENWKRQLSLHFLLVKFLLWQSHKPNASIENRCMTSWDIRLLKPMQRILNVWAYISSTFFSSLFCAVATRRWNDEKQRRAECIILIVVVVVVMIVTQSRVFEIHRPYILSVFLFFTFWCKPKTYVHANSICLLFLSSFSLQFTKKTTKNTENFYKWLRFRRYAYSYMLAWVFIIVRTYHKAFIWQ